MKILYLTATNTIGAGNRVLLSWIDYFMKKNYTIAASCPGGGLLSKYLQTILEKRYNSINFFTKSRFEQLKSLLNLWYVVHKFRPNLIHCNAEICFLIAKVVARIYNIPLLIHIRYHFDASFYNWIFKGHYFPKVVFFVTNALKQEEKNKIPLLVRNNSCLTVLHNCLNDPMLQVDDNHSIQNFNKHYYNLGCFAPIQERKNQKDLVLLAKKMKNRQIPFKIWIAGFIREQTYFRELMEFISSFGLENEIIFVGHLDNPFSFMKAMDINLSVSTYETFGMSVLESMALGVPVIAYRVPAVAEVIGNAGLLVPIKNINLLENCCYNLLQKENLRKNIGEKGRKRFLENFTPEKICPKLENIYLDIV
ncbi:MAG: glycosyltransferase [Desulfonauticus sp.]|nr:glycosyltransferase [Desulfonauticus sp.]